MVLKDFVQITEKYITDSNNNKEEAREVKDKTEEKANDTINELYNTSYLTIIAISDRKSKDPKIYESINNYIFDIKDYMRFKKRKDNRYIENRRKRYLSCIRISLECKILT
jgi:hypothetical protein